MRSHPKFEENQMCGCSAHNDPETWCTCTCPEHDDHKKAPVTEYVRLRTPGFYLGIGGQTWKPEVAKLKTLEVMQQEVLEVNQANGWFDDERTFGDGIALLISEASEALEAFRNYGLESMVRFKDDPIAVTGQSDLNIKGLDWSHVTEDDGGWADTAKPEGVGSEYADVLIRLLDACERDGVDLRATYEQKLAYNRTRGHKHGGKSL